MIKMTDKLEQYLKELKKTNSETYYHVLKTKKLVNEMVLLLNSNGETNFTNEEIDSICKGAILHDIGKLNIHNYILTKNSSLSPEEKSNMKNHTKIGWELIKNELNADEYDIIKNICLYHHERTDGQGYEGIADLPLYVQIVALCDSYDAIHSDRIYREGYSIVESLNMLREGKCGYIDVKLIDYIEQIVLNKVK